MSSAVVVVVCVMYGLLVCVQPGPSAVKMTLPAHICCFTSAASAIADKCQRLVLTDVFYPQGAQQQTCRRRPLLLSIDGIDGWMDRCLTVS